MTNNSYTNIFTGNPVWASTVSYIQYAITGNISLNWPTQFLDNPNTLGGWTSISANNNGYSVILPAATLASIGQSIVFINTSSSNFSFAIKDNAGSTLITLTQGKSVALLLTDTTTAAGTWLVFPFAQGIVTVTSVGATTTSFGLTIGGSPITSTGNLTFTLASGLQAIATLNSTGIMVQSSTGPSIMTTVSLIGGTNIDVTNADGTLGNPTIDLSDTLTGIVSAQIGSLTISNNTIQTTAGNVPIQIKPNGTGSILLGQGLTPPTIDATGNITNVATLSSINEIISTQLNAAALKITTNVLSTSTVNGNVNINANGTGSVVLQSISTNPFTINSTGNVIHPSVIRASVNFLGSNGTISASYNVTSVTRNSSGNYTINIPNGILTGTFLFYNVSTIAGDTSTIFVGDILTSSTLTSINLIIKNLSNAFADPTQVTFIVGSF